MASAHLLSVWAGPRQSQGRRRPGAGGHKTLCPERASMKTRPGMFEDASWARGLLTRSRRCSPRDRRATSPRAASSRRACPRAKAPGGR